MGICVQVRLCSSQWSNTCLITMATQHLEDLLWFWGWKVQQEGQKTPEGANKSLVIWFLVETKITLLQHPKPEPAAGTGRAGSADGSEGALNNRADLEVWCHGSHTPEPAAELPALQPVAQKQR